MRGKVVLQFIRVMVEHLTNTTETTELAVSLEDLINVGRG